MAFYDVSFSLCLLIIITYLSNKMTRKSRISYGGILTDYRQFSCFYAFFNYWLFI